MIFIATEVRPRGTARASRRIAQSLALVGACAVLAGCNAEPPAGEAVPVPEAGTDAPRPEPADPAAGETILSELQESGTDCPVLESRHWSARIEGDGSEDRRLHVSGEIDLPTPGYTASWSEGPADRRMPPAQHLLLELTPPPEMVAQVLTRLAVDYDGAATYPEYRAILVRCGNVVLASITDIDGPG